MISESNSSAASLKRKANDDDQDPTLPAAKRTKLADGTIPEDHVDSSDNTVRYCVTKESMRAVQEQLTRLTNKNREINASILEMRENSFDELLSIMRTRKIMLDQLGRPEVPKTLKEMCIETLPKRKAFLYLKEEELISVEELLGGHEAVLDYARSACRELEEKIELFEDVMEKSGRSGFTMDDFPRMQALAKLTAATSQGIPRLTNLATTAPITNSKANSQNNYKTNTSAIFPQFSQLPTEVRLMVWRAALPGPRVITHHAQLNKQMSLLAVCIESRQVVRQRYQRFLSPGVKFPRVGSSVIYVNPDIDTIVRDLTWISTGVPDVSLFDLEGPAFNLGCFRILTGLAKVKHLAIGFDVFHDNGGALFSQLQACCPDLEILTFFPSSQLHECPHMLRPRFRGEDLRFIDFDSNFANLIELRYERCRDRPLRNKALRAMVTLGSLSLPAAQYSLVFPEYKRQFGQSWNPRIRVALLMQWSPRCQGWRTRFLEGDRFSQGFPGDDRALHHGFIESEIVCDARGELLSRYDGIEALFKEDL